MLDQEWMCDHKQQFGIDFLCVIALIVVLAMEGPSSGQSIYSKCGVDPYTQCFQFLLYTLVPVFLARVALFVYYLKSEDRARIQFRVEEAFFMLQIFWSASYGYWTLYNFFSLSRGSLNCLARGQFSQMKIAYQVVMVCGGFPAVLCIGGFVFVVFAFPFIVYDYVKKEYRKKENDRRRNMLNQTLFTCNYQ